MKLHIKRWTSILEFNLNNDKNGLKTVFEGVYIPWYLSHMDMVLMGLRSLILFMWTHVLIIQAQWTFKVLVAALYFLAKILFGLLCNSLNPCRKLVIQFTLVLLILI